MTRFLNGLGIVTAIMLISFSAISVLFSVSGNRSQSKPQFLPIRAKARIGINKQLIKLEVAASPKEQALGLMHRTYVSPDRGMLFLIDPPRQASFWMKNVKIPLDLVFLRQGKVVALALSVPPCTATTAKCPTYDSKLPVDMVIELRGGRATELGLKVGESVNVEFLSDSR
jgi:uncharacterized protein